VDANHVIVEVAKVDAVFGLDWLIRIAGEFGEDFALRAEDLVEFDGRSLDPKYRLEVFRRGVLDDVVLNRIHSIIEMFNGGEGLVDGQLEETDQQVIGAIPEASLGSCSILSRS